MRTLFSFAAIVCLGWHASVAVGQVDIKQNEPGDSVTLAEVDFSKADVQHYGYAFAGYGLEGETQGKRADDKVKAVNSVEATGGDPDHCGVAKLDTSKLELPDNANYNYVGWGLGTVLELPQPINTADLSKYSISFQARVDGTEVLRGSKLMVSFNVPDDQVAKDDDQLDDVVVGLVRGQEDGTDTISLNGEYQSFTFNLKDDLAVNKGTLEALVKIPSQKISVSVQAQGTAYDIGQDADNVLFVDNIRLIKKK